MWIAIGSYVTNPYATLLNTTTENCWIYPNTTDTTPWVQDTTSYITMTTTEPPGYGSNVLISEFYLRLFSEKGELVGSTENTKPRNR